MIYYVRADHIGRPVFATNAAGVKVWSATYLPFGGVHTTGGTPIQLRFPGQWYQTESGLHQNWMRDYDPTTGRYMQADPLGLVDGASIYGYARQSPMRYTDPRGEQTITFPGIGSGVGTGTGIGSLPNIGPWVGTTPDGYRTESEQAQSDREHDRYKTYCDKMGPGSPPNRYIDPEGYCEWLQKAISHASECLFRVKEFDRRWATGGKHDQKLSDWIRRIDWLRKEQAASCGACSMPFEEVPPGFGITDPAHQPPMMYYCNRNGCFPIA